MRSFGKICGLGSVIQDGADGASKEPSGRKGFRDRGTGVTAYL